MACGKKLPHTIELHLQIWVTWASKITIKKFQLCSIKIKGSHAPWNDQGQCCGTERGSFVTRLGILRSNIHFLWSKLIFLCSDSANFLGQSPFHPNDKIYAQNPFHSIAKFLVWSQNYPFPFHNTVTDRFQFGVPISS